MKICGCPGLGLDYIALQLVPLTSPPSEASILSRVFIDDQKGHIALFICGVQLKKHDYIDNYDLLKYR